MSTDQFHLIAYSFDRIAMTQYESGNKIILPQSKLNEFTRTVTNDPLMFRVQYNGRTTHVGVIEFTAEEDHCYMPLWVMLQLDMGEGDIATLEQVFLTQATYVQLRPVRTQFYSLQDPKEALEQYLKNISCLSIGDHINVPYFDDIHEFLVADMKPEPFCSFIDTDVEVDFGPIVIDPVVGDVLDIRQHLKELKRHWTKVEQEKERQRLEESRSKNRLIKKPVN